MGFFDFIKSKTEEDRDKWIPKLIEWAKENQLPKREMSTSNWGDPEYIGFPDTDKFILEFADRDTPFTGHGFALNTGLFNENLINLNNSNIKDLPEEFYNLKGIYVLYLANNMISKLSEEIYQLKYLDTIDIGNNNLQYLPGNFVKLKYLHYIRLYNNDLRSLPNDIIYMEHLTEIALGGNSNLILNEQQKEWLLSLDPDNVSYDDDLLDRK